MNDDSNPLGKELGALLSEAARPVAPPAGAKHRVAGRLGAALGIPLESGIDLGFDDGAAQDGVDASGGDLVNVDTSGADSGGLDPSALDASGADLGGVDASSADLSSLDLGGVDASGLDPSAFDAGSLGLDQLAATHGHVVDSVQHAIEGGAAVVAGVAGAGKAAGAAFASAGSVASAATVVTASAATASGATAASATGAAGAGLVAAMIKPIVIGSFVAGAVLGGGTALVVKEKPPVLDVDKPRVVYVPAPLRTAPLPAETAAIARTDDDDSGPVEVAAPRARAKAALRAARPAIEKAPVLDEGLALEGPASEVLAEERAMLEIARAALTRGAHKDALKALDAHRDAFGQGALAEEREAMTILALVALGQEAEALAASRAFKKAYPSSAQWPVIEAALGATGVTDED